MNISFGPYGHFSQVSLMKVVISYSDVFENSCKKKKTTKLKVYENTNLFEKRKKERN